MAMAVASSDFMGQVLQVYVSDIGVFFVQATGARVVLPMPGVGRGRGQGGRGGPIKTFVPQAPGLTTAVTPEWMKKKTPTHSTPEEASSSTVNPFADSSPAAPAESAAAESLDTPVEADSAVPTHNEQLANPGASVLDAPVDNPSADRTATVTDPRLESQEPAGQSQMNDAFGGSSLDDAFGGGNGSSGSGGLGRDPLADAFGGGDAGTSGGGLAGDDTFGSGHDAPLDAFGGDFGLDNFAGSGLDDTFGGALASAGQVMLPFSHTHVTLSVMVVTVLWWSDNENKNHTDDKTTRSNSRFYRYMKCIEMYKPSQNSHQVQMLLCMQVPNCFCHAWLLMMSQVI